MNDSDDKSLNMVNKKLLVIDDEENMRHMLNALLTRAGYAVDLAYDGEEGLKCLIDCQYDFVLCDLKMPKKDGMAFLKEASGKLQNTTVIMMSAFGTIDKAVDAMKLGAYDFISKPFKSDEILLVLRKAEERENLKRENLRLKKQLKRIEETNIFGRMVAKSKAMESIFKLAAKVAQYNTTVLITGGSGTGKELVARGIHYSGPRESMPLIPVNCGGIPDNLLESELFGHKKGAFTGADRNKKGLFEEADHGTLFLDEIGELPLSLQVKLLRVLQESEIRPVGDAKSRKVDVRIIAATAKDLQEEVKNGNFREDLFYRLNVLSIKIPPLKDRPEDIPLLSMHFIERFNQKLGKAIKGVSPTAMSILLHHDWPGNVRELENIIERGVVLAEEDILEPDNLPHEFGNSVQAIKVDEIFNGFSLKAAQKIFEKRLIIKALTETGGNRSKASRLLEISHPSLLSKIKTYSISL